MLFDWFHKLMNPHCPHCKAELERKHEMDVEIERMVKTCQSCEILKLELEKAQRREQLALDRLLTVPTPQEPVKIEIPQIRQGKPWRVRQRELEEESRKEAEAILAERNKELESQIGITEEPTDAPS